MQIQLIKINKNNGKSKTEEKKDKAYLHKDRKKKIEVQKEEIS